METFIWSDRYATGIESIDSQHQQLVSLVNELGSFMLTGDEPADVQLQTVFKRLSDYAQFHFADEERVMASAGISPEHITLHHQHHQNFVTQLMEMWAQCGQMKQPAVTLHRFLASWLGYHILGEDQTMARQIVRIRSGISAEAAHAQETTRGERSTSALLEALQNLYGVLSQQNQLLKESNRALEERVAERTRELQGAYESLEKEHAATKDLLAHIEKVQSQLLQSEKMASIGQLAAGVAHEINNPIGFVRSNLSSLEKYVASLLHIIDAAADHPAAQAAAREVDLPFVRSDLTDLMSESREGLERVRKIVSNLKDFSHVDQAEWQDADLVKGLEDTINVVWHELKYKVELVRELVPLPPVRCIPAQINQVYVNLLINAAQAIPEHGLITLRSGQDGEKVWIEVADNGVGMSEEVRRRIFDPFFTTKPVGQGTGLGMSVAYDIVRNHGGSFDVTSTPGAGSCLRLWLPVGGPV